MGKFYKILIVDDTIKNLQLLCEILQEEKQYKVNVARNGQEALDMASRVDFDLILLDIQMPIMDGFETCRKLKENPKTKAIPIIFLTAQVEKEKTIEGFELGAVDYITKPFNSTELIVRIKTQIELKTHRENLEIIVHQRTEQLENALKQVNSDTIAKEEFLATMSHEIRTPLNGIQGMSTLLSSTDLSADQKFYIDTLKNSTNYLQRIIDDIFDFTLIHAGDIETEKEDFNVHTLLHKCSQLHKFRSEEKGLTFTQSHDESLNSYVHGDIQSISKIITQLLSNAYKFTDSGSISIHSSIEKHENKLELTVQIDDTGIGISQENHDNIFEKFTQVDSSSQRTYEGTGMGLALCKQLLSILDGSIAIKSEINKGSCFTVKIPLTAAKAMSAEKGEVHQNSKILIVEDNVTNQIVTERLLTGMGHQVSIAENGMVALNMLTGNQYDLILMDCMMPLLDGYETTKRIRLSDTHQDIPIIALTANTLVGDREKCINSGMNDYLPKPIGRDALKAMVSKYL